MLVCMSCQGDACTYGANRGGVRTESCCVCAQKHGGWSGFAARACAGCRQPEAAALPCTGGNLPHDDGGKTMAAAPPEDFHSAVRELRRKRLQPQDSDDHRSLFKKAFDELHLKRMRTAAELSAPKLPSVMRKVGAVMDAAKAPGLLPKTASFNDVSTAANAF